MERSHEATSPSWQVGDYVAYFADQLIEARPGTDEHLTSFRNYVFSIGAAACEKLVGSQKVTDQVMNDLFNQNLKAAAKIKNLQQAPEIASISLSKAGWRRYWYEILEDLGVHDLPKAPIDFLAALATAKITHKSITD